jgi:hypothetical protein
VKRCARHADLAIRTAKAVLARRAVSATRTRTQKTAVFHTVCPLFSFLPYYHSIFRKKMQELRKKFATRRYFVVK